MQTEGRAGVRMASVGVFLSTLPAEAIHTDLCEPNTHASQMSSRSEPLSTEKWIHVGLRVPRVTGTRHYRNRDAIAQTRSGKADQPR